MQHNTRQKYVPIQCCVVKPVFSRFHETRLRFLMTWLLFCGSANDMRSERIVCEASVTPVFVQMRTSLTKASFRRVDLFYTVSLLKDQYHKTHWYPSLKARQLTAHQLFKAVGLTVLKNGGRKKRLVKIGEQRNMHSTAASTLT